MPLYERFYPVDSKTFFLKDEVRISSEYAELYEKGLSLGDIAGEAGCSKNKVRVSLLKSGIELRTTLAQAACRSGVSAGKRTGLPYYGFCYLDGAITKDPREYPTLQFIYRRWIQKKSIHEIVLELNQVKRPSRKGKTWSWAAVQNIVIRFAKKKIILKNGGEYELR